MDCGKAVACQTVRGGTRRLIEAGRDLGEELLWIGWQTEVLVGLCTPHLPASVIMDQVPEGDVIAALREEQTAGAQGFPHGEGEGDLPDMTVEFTVRDEVGPPVRLNEAVRVSRRERPRVPTSSARRMSIACSNGSLPAAAWNGKVRKLGRYWRSVP